MTVRSLSRGLLLLAALSGAAGVSLTAAPTVARAQGAGLPIVSTSLLRFEAAVTWASVSPGWAARRGAWSAAVNGAQTPEQLAAQVLALEAAMGWSAVQPSWRRDRPAWVARGRAAHTAADVATLLLGLENVTKWESVAASWRTDRGPWVSALGSVAGR